MFKFGSTPITHTAPTLEMAEMFGVTMPLPALQRGWLHSRELILPWDVERIIDAIGDGAWFTHYCRFRAEVDKNVMRLRPYSFAGFWPGGGFVELRLGHANPLENLPRSTLCVYAGSPAAAEALMDELLSGYCLKEEPRTETPAPRVGMLNHQNNELVVERIPISSEQTVPRDRVDLYYRAGASAWADRWIEALNTRRYGLTVLTGHPGTGKTTLLRSIAHWLAETHVFYFMPASRFATIESGSVVSFWAEENRASKLRKVLILEDAESILLRRADDNREKVATLLNLTDGMLGDALGLHVVCTLNSELADLDPALLRPGRLVAHREFELLTAEEAKQLAAVLGLRAPDGDRVSLAELFNPPADHTGAAPQRAAPRRSMGFHTLMN